MNKKNIEIFIVIILLIMMFFLPGWLQLSILGFNSLSFIILSFILMKISNLKHYNEQKNSFKEFVNRHGDIIPAMSVIVIGFLFGVYNLYIFYKNPLRKQYDNIQQQERDIKLKKLGL